MVESVTRFIHGVSRKHCGSVGGKMGLECSRDAYAHRATDMPFTPSNPVHNGGCYFLFFSLKNVMGLRVCGSHPPDIKACLEECYKLRECTLNVRML